MTVTNSSAFALVARAIRQMVVEECGGVHVTDRQTLWEDILLSEPTLEGCGESVRKHLTFNLRRFGVASRPFDDDPDTLLLYDLEKYKASSAFRAWQSNSEEAEVFTLA